MESFSRFTSTPFGRRLLSPATGYPRAISAIAIAVRSTALLAEERRPACRCCWYATSPTHLPVHQLQRSRCASSTSTPHSPSGGIDTTTTADQGRPSTSASASSNLLSTALLRRIKADLLEADAAGANNRRIDDDELKAILRKYTDAFSDDDVETICDLFFVATGGKSVSHTTFLRAVQQTAAAASDAESIGDGEDEIVLHQNRSKRPNPLGFQSVEDMGCWTSPGGGNSAYHDTQGEAERHLLKYIREMLRKSGREPKDT